MEKRIVVFFFMKNLPKYCWLVYTEKEKGYCVYPKNLSATTAKSQTLMN